MIEERMFKELQNEYKISESNSFYFEEMSNFDPLNLFTHEEYNLSGKSLLLDDV
jgi:hypothetical protein